MEHFRRRLCDCHLYVGLYVCMCLLFDFVSSIVLVFLIFVRSVCSKQKSIIVTTGYASTAQIGQNTKNSSEHMFCSVSCWRIIVIATAAAAAAAVDVSLLFLLFFRFIQQGWRKIRKQRWAVRRSFRSHSKFPDLIQMSQLRNEEKNKYHKASNEKKNPLNWGRRVDIYVKSNVCFLIFVRRSRLI